MKIFIFKKFIYFEFINIIWSTRAIFIFIILYYIVFIFI